MNLRIKYVTINRMVPMHHYYLLDAQVQFLIYINNLPNCSDTLKFRILADDPHVFASTLAYVAGVKRGGGRGGGREFGQKKTEDHIVFFFSSSPTPSPLYACYAGYSTRDLTWLLNN